jgi:hypothetical protein
METTSMYKQSANIRKYSTTPIVKVTEEGKEEIVCVITLPKKDGEELAVRIVDMLNNYENIIAERDLEEARFKAIDDYIAKRKLTR